MEEFLLREVMITSNDGSMTVSRQRNSIGYGSIQIKVSKKGMKEQTILFQSKNGENDGQEEEYVGRVKELAEMLNKIADNRCELPKIP